MSPFATSLVLALTALSASASCLHGTSLLKREVEGGQVKVATFGYTGEKGPLNWAGLDQANSACAIGKAQSPIAIDGTVPKATSPPDVQIPTVEEAEFENLGSTVEVIVNGTTTFEGKAYHLKQFHFHTPSEHRINEVFYPLEMHMVHESDDGSFVVLAVPFDLTEDGCTLDLLTNVVANLDAIREPGTITQTGKLDFAELALAFKTQPLFQYTGSLTTPPCSEGITFLVMESPMNLNVKTFNALKSVIKFNSRYSQNTLGATNLIQVGAQSAQLNCNAAPGTETSPSHARSLVARTWGSL
jgi:carbonic anhydrase